MGNRARFGTIDWAAGKAATACRHGLSQARRDCHAKAGDWIRRNPGLASDPDCRLILFALPSGTIGHSGILYGGKVYHDASDIAGHPLDHFKVAARIPASTILGAAMTGPEQAGMAP